LPELLFQQPASVRDLVIAYAERLQLCHITPAEWAIGSPSAAVLCNLALKRAAAQRILLLDGRCIPDSNLIEHHARFGAEAVAPCGFRRIYPRDKLYDFVTPLDYAGMALHSFEDPRRSPGAILFGDWRDVEGFSLSAPTEALRNIEGIGGAKYAIDFPDVARQLSVNGCRLRPLWTEPYVTYLD